MELPLFPLNTVLFPGAPLGLHIFEDRYKKMIQRCLAAGEGFGVVLIRHGEEALGPLPDPHPIGCLARIAHVQTLSEGRYNLLAIGEERFKVLALRRNQPYLVGEVELAPPSIDDPSQLASVAGRLRPSVEHYLGILASAGQSRMDLDDLPEAPLDLAYLAAYVLQLPATEKQAFLGHDLAADLVAEIAATYRREVPLLRAMLNRQPARQAGPFSLN